MPLAFVIKELSHLQLALSREWSVLQGASKQDSLNLNMRDCMRTLDATSARAKEILETDIAEMEAEVRCLMHCSIASLSFIHLWRSHKKFYSVILNEKGMGITCGFLIHLFDLWTDKPFGRARCCIWIRNKRENRTLQSTADAVSERCGPLERENRSSQTTSVFGDVLTVSVW